MSDIVQLTNEEARRLALTAQGFAERKPTLRSLVSRLHAFQLDPINVVVRAQYMPAFSRLGPYKPADFDSLAYKRQLLFEYMAHAACLVDVSLFPLLRWRMDRFRHHPRWEVPFLKEALAEVTDRGALTPSDLTFQRRYEKQPGRWGGSYGKTAMRHLAWSGEVVVAGRRGIEQLYDLPARVLPAAVLDAPAVPEEDAKRALLVKAAAALGVGTAKDLGEYFGLRNIATLLDALVRDGQLVAADVKGSNKKAYLHPAAKAKPIDRHALLSPFDSFMWTRERVQRLFGFDYLIEIYVPEAKRKYGYYVYPFLMGEDLVARVDLKGDRKASALLVQGAFAEPTASAAQVAPALATELHTMAGWLGLDRVEVKANGDLAPALRKAV